MSEKEVIELEESGDEEDLGKYMIDDDEEEDGVEEVKEIDKLPNNIEKSEQKTIDENKYGTKYYDTEDTDQLRKYMAESIPSLSKRKGLKLPVHGNERTMNLNHLILANITESAYFRVDLAQFKQFDQLVDEIYYRVTHLEPWEKGSRKHFTGSTTGGERGMAYSSIPGVSNYVGVRGVGQGGIVSTPFCCLYKLWTLKLNRKQIEILIDHQDSPFLRGLGFLYLRFSLPPENLLDFFAEYLEDDEQIDPKAGFGDPMTIGQMCLNMLEDNQWYGTMFPRIPAKHLQKIRKHIKELKAKYTEHTFNDQMANKRERSRSPSDQKKKRRDPRDLDERPASSNRYRNDGNNGKGNRSDRRY